MFRKKKLPQDDTAHQGLSNIKGIASKIMEVKFKNSLGTINYSIFPPGLTKLYNIVKEVKNPNAYKGVILRTRFSPGNTSKCIRPGY